MCCKESKPQDAFSANQWRGRPPNGGAGVPARGKLIKVEDEDLENRLQMIALEEKRRVEGATSISWRRDAMEHMMTTADLLETIDALNAVCSVRHAPLAVQALSTQEHRDSRLTSISTESPVTDIRVPTMPREDAKRAHQLRAAFGGSV